MQAAWQSYGNPCQLGRLAWQLPEDRAHAAGRSHQSALIALFTIISTVLNPGQAQYRGASSPEDTHITKIALRCL